MLYSNDLKQKSAKFTKRKTQVILLCVKTSFVQSTSNIISSNLFLFYVFQYFAMEDLEKKNKSYEIDKKGFILGNITG